ncbi:hypothetical protein RQP46_001841 [Phenoliferia psychrophenolica]
MFLGDTDRILVNLPPGVDKDTLGLEGGEPLTLRALTRDTVAKSPVDDKSDQGGASLVSRKGRLSKENGIPECFRLWCLCVI